MTRRLTNVVFVLVGLAVTVALVVLVAPNADPNPDGLERVAAETGIDSGVTEHALADGPFADYGTSGVDNTWVATWIAGLLGVAVTFAVCAGLVLLARRTRRAAG